MTSLELIARTIAVNSIDVYKAHLSPRKGFSCAHRVFYGGESCSTYVKSSLLGKASLISALAMSVQRFKACSSASYALRTTRADGGCIIIPCCLPF